MRVKKFEARTMKEALRMVKSELGPEAVILGARENKRSFGLGGETSFEVTAAVSESTLQKKRFVESRLKDDDRDKFRAADARMQRRMIEKMVEKRLPAASSHQFQASQGGASSASNLIQKPVASTDPSWKPRPITKISYIDIPDEVSEERTNQVYASRRSSEAQSRSVPTVNVDAKEVEVRGRIRSLAREAFEAGRITVGNKHQEKSAAFTSATSLAGASQVQEIASLKNEINRLQSLLEGFQKVPQSFSGTSHPGADFGLSYDFSRCFQKLTEAGVSPELAAEILHRAAQEIDPMNAKKSAIIEAWVAKWFLQNISICQRPLASKFHLFVGPMGGGKTSQLVKTAAQLVIREKKRVAIVTTDTMKVGAVDQLKIYCQILNVPFAIVRDRSEWQWLESQTGAIDHVLIDCPGVALRDMDEIQVMRSLVPNLENMSTHLCLSSSMKESDALEVARRFRVLQPTDLVFTGLDLSIQHGVIATVQMRSGLPLHSFGTGAQVPEDFELATKERVLDLLFKLSSIKRTVEKKDGI
jgi:flagellar biosynthesis protein FlhF